MKEPQIENNGRQESLSQWVYQFGDALYSWTLYKTSQPTIAEDLVQETFMAALQSFDKFQAKSSPKTWLFSILNHKIIDYYRKRFRNPVIIESTDASGKGDNLLDILFDKDGDWKKEYRPQHWHQPSELLDDPDFENGLQYCMEKLPVPWFSAIQLKYMEGKEGKKISQELEITASNYWQILHRAKLQLRSCLEQWLNN